MTYEQYQADRLMRTHAEMHDGILVEQGELEALSLDALADYIRQHLPNRNKQSTATETRPC